MYMILILFFMILFILIILMMLNFILAKKLNKDREKMSSFECGFDPMTMNRLPFSLQFYLISIIFLIFDIEIAVIFPLVYMNSFNYYYMIISILLILMILLLGLLMEWIEGALKWMK